MIELFMNELSESFVKDHVDRWINAWNNKDLKTVLSMYTNNIQFYSPKIKLVFPELKSEKINNKKDLEYYWSTALIKFDNLHFTPKAYFIKGHTCLFEYFATFDGKSHFLVIEKFEFKDSLIDKSSVFYGSQTV